MASLDLAGAKAARAMVVGPAIVLSAIFALTVVVSLIVADRTGVAPQAIAAGAACFAAAIVLLVRRGLRQIARLERLGLTDALTGLPNRHALHHDFRQLTRSADEVALALIDLDGFMLVNEHYGHTVGDRAIREAGAIFLTICGEEATVYRLGGDEFALLKSGPLAATLLEGMCRRRADDAPGQGRRTPADPGRQHRARPPRHRRRHRLVRAAAPQRRGDVFLQARRQGPLHLVQPRIRPQPRSDPRARRRIARSPRQ
jgi:GGDEF domain-containing protein